MNEVTIVVKAVDETRAGFSSVASGSKSLAAGIAGVGVTVVAALGAIGAKSVEMASKFDAATTMLVTQAGISESQLGSLRNQVLNLAGAVGFSPDSLAESLYHVASNMASTGASTKQMMDVVKIAAEGAKVGGANLVDVTNALTAAIASGIPGVQNYSQAMGVLNATVGSGDMKMQDLADALGTGMLATVKGFGLSITDVGAALAVFGDNNIRGAAAGNQLRMTVQALAVPTKQGAALFKEMGMSTDQLARDMQSGGLLKALEDLKSHMDAAGISATQQGQILTEMFGKKAGVGVNILYDQLGRLQGKYPELTKAANGFGDAWQRTQQNLSTIWDQIKGGFDAVLIKLGEFLTPKIMAGINDFRTAWTKLEPEIKKVVAAFNFGGSLKAIQNDFKNVADQVKKNWPEIKEIVGVVGAAILVIIKVILSLVDYVIKLDAIMIQVWARITDAVNAFVRTALNVLGTFIDGAAKAFGWIPGIGGQLKGAAAEFDKFKNQVNNALDSITNRTVTVNAVIRYSSTGTMNARGPTIGFQAHGGVIGSGYGGVFAAASGMVTNGLTMVGEHGAELVSLPAGSTVHSNPDTQRMMQNMGGGGATNVSLQVVASGGGRGLANFLQEMIRTKQIQLKVVNNRVVAY